MKKAMILLSLILFIFTLSACSTSDDNDDNDKSATITTEAEEEGAATEDSNDIESTSDSSNGLFEVTQEDQRDLTIGDTGVFQTTLGTYEVTLHSAEIVGSELDGEPSLFDELIVLELTFKNIGDNVILAEEIMYDMEITDDLEASGSSNGAEMFDSLEVFEGEIQPGEEKNAQFIGDIYTADEYFFGKAEGNVAAGTSNQVIWVIPDNMARHE
ncbi:hypothetical protein [Oceanobacillus sp. CAU 1775]